MSYHPKTVLVCFGEIRREVTFSSLSTATVDIELSSDARELLKQIGVVFRDVITPESLGQVIVLLKNEDWSGEFLEVTGGYPIDP